MQFDSFENVASLSSPELRELLNDGDTTERVWAAWALAMRLGENSVHELTEVARQDPPSGLRRHLAVILAGYGERAALRTFAESDPDPRVRATACLYLLQIRSTHDRETDDLLLSVLFEDPDPSVRSTILTNGLSHGLSISVSQLLELASDPSVDLRTAALNVLDDHSLGQKAVQTGLGSLLEHETEPKLLQKIAALCTDGKQPVGVLQVARKRDRVVRLCLLGYFADRRMTFEWADLEGFADVSDDSVSELILKLTSEECWFQAFPWISARLAHRIKRKEPPYWDAASWSRFIHLLDTGADVRTNAQTFGDLRIVLEVVRKEVKEYKDVDPTDFDDKEMYEDWYPKEHFETLMALEPEIVRLLSTESGFEPQD